MPKYSIDLPYEYVSPSNAKRLEEVGSPMARKGRLQIVDQVYTRQDIERLKRQPSANKTPFIHTVLAKNHYWFRSISKRYVLYALMDRLRIALGVA